MKITIRYFSWLLFISIAFAAVQPAVAQDEGSGGEAYTVRKGDTLWDISASKLENPFSWSKIWKQNPDIKDPDLIFPGEKIALPPGAVLKKSDAYTDTSRTPDTMGGPVISAPTHRPDSGPFVEKGNTITKAPPLEGKIISLDVERPKVPVATATEMMNSGFIASGLKGVRKITGDLLGGRDVYSMGDKIYTDADGVSIGEIFLIGRISDKVKDPASGKDLGKLIFPSGSLRITEKVDGKMVGVVVDSFTAILSNDILIPYAQPQFTYEPVQPNPALNGKFGYVAAVRDDKTSGAMGDVVYLDMGSDMGVKPGDRFVIRRSGYKGSTTEDISNIGYVSPSRYVVPDHVVGEVEVITVQPNSSTAKVDESKEAVRSGYRAVYKD